MYQRVWARRTAWLLCGLLVLGVVAALSFTQVSDPDAGFHLATGRAVLQLGRIPDRNVLSYTQPEHPWILHEWLPGVIFEIAYRKGGAAGLLAIKLGLCVATFGVVLRTAALLGAAPSRLAAGAVLAAGAAGERFMERPQLFSGLCLALCGLLLARPKRRRLLGTALVIALNYQLHAGALIALIYLGAVGLGAALDARPGWRPMLRALLPYALTGMLALLLGGALLLLTNPSGLRVLLVPFQLSEAAYLRAHIAEFRSPIYRDPSIIWPYWLLVAVALVAMGMRLRERGALRTLVPGMLFLGLSLRHGRLVDAFAISATPVVALALSGVTRIRAGAWWALALVLAPLLPWAHYQRFPRGVGLSRFHWPAELLDYVERYQLRGPAYVSDSWAGPFLGAFYPRERAFFDPRFEAYPVSFVTDAYQHIRYGRPGWEGMLERYGVRLVLMKYTSAAERSNQGGRPNLRQLLVRSPNWVLVGFNQFGALYVRKGLEGELAIPGVDPDRGEIFGPGAVVGLRAAQRRGLNDLWVQELLRRAERAGP